MIVLSSTAAACASARLHEPRQGIPEAKPYVYGCSRADLRRAVEDAVSRALADQPECQ